MPIFIPQFGDESLSPNAHRVSLAGSIEGLEYPLLCPACGTTASEKLAIAKVFIEQDSEVTYYRVAKAKPFFCPACIAQHRSEEQPVTAGDLLKVAVRSKQMIPTVAMTSLSLFLMVKVLPNSTARLQGVPIVGALIAIFLGLAWLCFRKPLGQPHNHVPPQTSVSLAFDFGDNEKSYFATGPRLYAFRNRAYAEAFEQLNAARSAELLGPEQKQREKSRLWIAGAIAVVLFLLIMFYRH
jgi:hypothetical protein